MNIRGVPKMYITIKAKTKNGEDAIKKLMAEKSFGLAIRSFTNTNPLEVKITPTRGQRMFSQAIKVNPHVIPAIDGPFRSILNDYGAKDKDFVINVVV